MSTNRPRCPVCGNPTKKNGTTSKGTTRWRCTHCGASATRDTQSQATNAATFHSFITWTTGKKSLAQTAADTSTSISTLRRRYSWCWLIRVPCTPDPYLIHDQIFIDGTYLAGGCLLIAATTRYVINWHWCKSETTASYLALFTGIAAPIQVVTDGGQGAQAAIKKHWPTATVQRCLVHIQRNIRRQTTSRPRTPAGKTLYRLALKLTRITDLDDAAAWIARLQEFGTIYADYLNEKTLHDPVGPGGRQSWSWTHERVRKGYNTLLSVYRRGHLFNYLTVSNNKLISIADTADTADGAGTTREVTVVFKSTTNSLEGGINSVLKDLAKAHRGLRGEHQRIAIEWWLHSRTQAPADPVKIARGQQWARTARTRAHALLAAENPTPSDDGRPASYDTAIDSTYQHSMGIRKGSVH